MATWDWRKQISKLYRPRGNPQIQVLGPDERLDGARLRSILCGADREDGTELHLLAFDFPLDWNGRPEFDYGTERVRLVRIPHEIAWGNPPREPVFVEAARLTVRPVFHADGTADVRLIHFRPGLPISPPVSEAVRRRAAQSGFDFLNYWAVDWEYPGETGGEAAVFRHRWRSLRSAKDRRLKLESEAHFPWEPNCAAGVAVKATDVYGYETLALVRMEPALLELGEGPAEGRDQ